MMPRRQRPTFDSSARLAAAEGQRAEVEAAAARLGLAMEHVEPHLGGGRWRFTCDERFVMEWAPLTQRFVGRRQGGRRSTGVWGYAAAVDLAARLAELVPRREGRTHAEVDAEMDRPRAQAYT